MTINSLKRVETLDMRRFSALALGGLAGAALLWAENVTGRDATLLVMCAVASLTGIGGVRTT